MRLLDTGKEISTSVSVSKWFGVTAVNCDCRMYDQISR